MAWGAPEVWTTGCFPVAFPWSVASNFRIVVVCAAQKSLGFQRVRENSGSECPRLLGLWGCVCPAVRRWV